MTPVGGTIGAIRFDEGRQRLLAHNRREDVLDDALGLFQGCFRHLEVRG